MEIILWLACGVTTIIAAALASRSRQWRYIGRGAVGVLFLLGGALVNASYLAAGRDYAGFADPAHFAWVTDAWRAVVAPNVVPWIGLLVVFGATVGALILRGGRRTQLGYVGVIGFYLALWLFGWFETLWVLAMFPPMLLLLRAERRAATAPAPPRGAAADRCRLLGAVRTRRSGYPRGPAGSPLRSGHRPADRPGRLVNGKEVRCWGSAPSKPPSHPGRRSGMRACLLRHRLGQRQHPGHPARRR
jgi:hypothetical protein